MSVSPSRLKQCERPSGARPDTLSVLLSSQPAKPGPGLVKDMVIDGYVAPTGDQLRVLNGIYLNDVKLGRMNEAEQACGKVVAHGIAFNELDVKFLFKPGSTVFRSDAKPSGMGFRQNTVGSGTDNVVDALDRRVEFKIVPCG